QKSRVHRAMRSLARRCAYATSGHAAAPPSNVMNSRRLTARCLLCSDSTPRHGRLLHPSSWAERDDRDHAADNFFQGGSPKIGYPTSAPATPLTTKNRFTPNFRGSAYVLGTDLNCSESLASHRQWPVIHPFEITHIQGLGSFAVGENAPKGCDQPIKFDRLRIKLVAPRRERLFAFTGERVRGEGDDG